MAERSGPALLAKGIRGPGPLSVCPGVLGGTVGSAGRWSQLAHQTGLKPGNAQTPAHRPARHPPREDIPSP